MVQLLGGNSLDILRLLFLLLVVSGDVERNPGPLKTAASEGDLFRIEKIYFPHPFLVQSNFFFTIPPIFLVLFLQLKI